jgi:hypothetical protein
VPTPLLDKKPVKIPIAYVDFVVAVILRFVVSIAVKEVDVVDLLEPAVDTF